MDETTLALLGRVKLTNSVTKQHKTIEVQGFDVLGFFFAPLRLLFGGMPLKAFGCFVFMFTVIGIPISSWYVGFNFRQMRFKNELKKGWEVASKEGESNSKISVVERSNDNYIQNQKAS